MKRPGLSGPKHEFIGRTETIVSTKNPRERFRRKQYSPHAKQGASDFSPVRYSKELRGVNLQADADIGSTGEAEKCLLVAQKKAKLISKFPFVRGVLASGSLSKGYMDEKSDIDFFIITAPRRLWIARTLLVLYKRLFLGGSHKHFCVNYFVDEDHLEIEEKNLFTATELATVIPLYGSELYSKLIETNDWLKGFFPNHVARSTENVPKPTETTFKKFLETLINACLANKIESYFKSLTMKRWKKLYETQYSKSDFDIAFKSKAYASKNHPQHFQRKVMEIYAEKLKLFNFSSVLKNNRPLPVNNDRAER